MAKCETCGKAAHEGCCEGCMTSHELSERPTSCFIGPAWLQEPVPLSLEEAAEILMQSQKRRKKQ